MVLAFMHSPSFTTAFDLNFEWWSTLCFSAGPIEYFRNVILHFCMGVYRHLIKNVGIRLLG